MTVTLMFISALYFIYNLVLAIKYYKDTGDREYICEHGYTPFIGRVFNFIGIIFFGLVVEIYYEVKYSW